MVPKNERGIKYPLHVQKHIHGTKEPKFFCENEVCMQFMSVFHNSGLQNELCRHLKSVSAKNSFFPEKTILHDDYFYMILLTLLVKINISCSKKQLKNAKL